MWLQLLGFISEEGSGKYLYEGDFGVDSIKVNYGKHSFSNAYWQLS